MKVTTDACLFGAWVAGEIGRLVQPPAKLLDIGAGTGLLSLQVAQKNTGQITAIEIDGAAAAQAQQNIGASLWCNQIQVIAQDLLQWPSAPAFDCIFSNPPFYEKEIRSEQNGKNLAHHDAGLTLAHLLQFIKNHLSEEGCFFLLLPVKRQKAAEALFGAHGLYFQQIVYVQQTLKHQPFRMMIQGRRKEVDAVTIQTISIKNRADAYTPEFVSLLQAYYLIF